MEWMKKLVHNRKVEKFMIDVVTVAVVMAMVLLETAVVAYFVGEVIEYKTGSPFYIFELPLRDVIETSTALSAIDISSYLNAFGLWGSIVWVYILTAPLVLGSIFIVELVERKERWNWYD